MNRTLRDSREVLYLIDKMQGKKSELQQESPTKIKKKSEAYLSRRVVTEPKIEEMK